MNIGQYTSEYQSTILERAIDVAVKSHQGQTDKAGQPYILHPLRVMMRMQTHEERIAAVLHDVIEDTDVTIDDLGKAGVPQDVLVVVDHLTHRPDESYEAYVERIATHPIARRIKIADLEDNMDFKRLAQITEKDLARWQKYHRAWVRLKEMESPNQALHATSEPVPSAASSSHEG
jgi:(p)ppGpp synthase/HD superfamily hydrolase